VNILVNIVFPWLKRMAFISLQTKPILSYFIAGMICHSSGVLDSLLVFRILRKLVLKTSAGIASQENKFVILTVPSTLGVINQEI